MAIDLLVLFFLSFIAATISGAAGFGGALVLLPVLTNIVGIKAAIPVLTIGQVFGNASRVWFGRRDISWKPIVHFLSTAIPLTILGSYLFSEAESNTIKAFIGIFLLLLVIYRRLERKNIFSDNIGMILGGGLTGFFSGLAGSAGPLGGAFFLGLNLKATTYVASEAFTALTIHLIKSVMYNRFALLGNTELFYGLYIGSAMILGSWAGRKIIEKISRKKFILLVEFILVITALQFILLEI